MKRFQDPRYFVVSLLAVVILAGSVFHARWTQAPSVHADAGQNLSGYAWSDNIGWVSFNCAQASSNTCATANYGVNIDPTTGNFSGYAWSDSIGYISFNPSDVSGCPSGSCPPVMNTTTYAVTGWAKALTANGSGWDGWIKLSDAGSPAYGPTLSGTTFSGYSWGSDVVGWLSWSGSGYGVTSTFIPTCIATLTPTPSPINQGGTSQLTWSVSYGSLCASSCTGTGFSTGAGNPISSTGSGVTVSPTLPSNNKYALNCIAGTYGPPPPVNTTVAILVPAVTITANPAHVADGGSTTITWTAANVTSCSVTGYGLSPDPRTDYAATPTSQLVTVSSTSPTYTIVCQPNNTTASVNVNTGASIKEY